MVTDDPPGHCYAQCQVAFGDCLHRGDETRLVGCESCGGNVQIKVFACAVRGECTAAQSLDGLACCATCEQFEAAT